MGWLRGRLKVALRCRDCGTLLPPGVEVFFNQACGCYYCGSCAQRTRQGQSSQG